MLLHCPPEMNGSVLLSAMPERASFTCGNANVEKHTCCRYLKLEGLPCGCHLLSKSQSSNSYNHKLAVFVYPSRLKRDYGQAKKKKRPQRTAKPLHDGLHVKLPVRRALNIDCGGWEALVS